MTAAGRSGLLIRAFDPGAGDRGGAEDRAGDLDAVVGVWERASALAHPFLTPEFVATERVSVREVYLPRSVTWVAELDAVVVGFLSLLGDEIGSLFVEPALHRTGVGRALLARARAEQPVLDVQVYEENSIGRAFYARTGFVFVDSRVQAATGQVLHRLRLVTDAGRAADRRQGDSLESARERARTLARAARERGQPLEWFEELYRELRRTGARVPWADLEPNPGLVAWSEREEPEGRGARALVVGCGAGDDAEYLASLGYRVTAFDISPSAIEWCRERFPASGVEYVAADLFDALRMRKPAWNSAFDFVFESYTLQSLPPELQPSARAAIASFVAPGGRLLAIARGRDEADERGELPWPLTPAELGRFTDHALRLAHAEDDLDAEQPPVRRLRFEFRRTN